MNVPAKLSAPDALLPLLAGRQFSAVWRNELGGVTYEVPGEFFVKWAPAGSGLRLNDEAVRLRWAGRWVRVPRVLGQGEDDEGSWLQTAALAGESAVSDRCKADPVSTVIAIGEGLRALHDTLPVDDCPFDWSAESRVQVAGRLPARTSRQWHSEHQGLTVESALCAVSTPPPVDRLVVCHGDACAPNTLVGADGRWSGHVDFGDLGLADRWADLAVATWSTTWNYGNGLEQTLLDAYGIGPDRERTAYYRLLWDLGP